MAVASATARIAAFDTLNPLKPGARAWAARRRMEQEDGNIPLGQAQAVPRHLHAYIDDAAGVALSDEVDLDARPRGAFGPEPLPHGRDATIACGGVPAGARTRAVAHFRIAASAYIELGFDVEHSKSMAGDRVISLGFLVDIPGCAIRCTQTKRDVMTAELNAIKRKVTHSETIKRKRVRTVVGRLTNLSMIMPEIVPYLSPGYTLANHPLGHFSLAVGSPVASDMTALCDHASGLLDANEGIPLCPRAAFPDERNAGTATIFSDASGHDGVGGYATLPELEGVIFILSEAWPADVRAALENSSRRKEERDATGERLPMPAAETFGSALLAVALARAKPVHAVVTVTDCQPSAFAINAAASPSRPINRLIAWGRGVTPQWLAVHIPRELNTAADVLSHPSRAEEVARAVAGTRQVVWLRATEADWDVLREAFALTPAGWEW